MANLFAKAKVIEAPKPKSKKPDRAEVTMPGLGEYATVVSLIKNLETLAKTLREDLDGQMRANFVKFGENGVRPENYRGTDGEASASCELRKRSTASALTPEEIALFAEKGIPCEEVELVAQRYIINPVYMTDQAKLEQVSKALEKVKNIPDFILLQEGSTKHVVTDESVATVFSKKLAGELLDKVCCLAIKPKVEDTDIERTMIKVRSLITGKPEAEIVKMQAKGK